MSDGTFISWLALDGDTIIGTNGMFFIERPPIFGCPSGKMGILMSEYSKKKLAKVCEILKMISENPNISIDELRIALDVTDRIIVRYISELKDKGIIERKGTDNGGEWKIK